MATSVGTGTKSQRIEPLTKRKAWKALQTHYEKVRKLHLRNLFAADPKRGERMTAEAEGVFLDYSKNRITDETVKLLVQLAEESGLRARIDAMFPGREDQHHREASGPARGPACSQRNIHPCRRRGRSAPGPRRAR